MYSATAPHIHEGISTLQAWYRAVMGEPKVKTATMPGSELQDFSPLEDISKVNDIIFIDSPVSIRPLSKDKISLRTMRRRI